MTAEEWKQRTDQVTDAMKEFTRPFVTMLVSRAGAALQIGTGTFVDHGGTKLLTCEHVARFDPKGIYVDGAGYGELEKLGSWDLDASVDVALASLPQATWSAISGRAGLLSTGKFARRHEAVYRELFFFRGIAHQNANVSAFGTEATLTGYCSQRVPGTADPKIIEIEWNPERAQFTTGTAPEVARRIRKDDPAGFSGSLVWNTRFVRRGSDLRKWKPTDAVVMGLLRRFDDKRNRLLVLKQEHLWTWLQSHP